MINYLQIENFKSLKNIGMNLSKLNLFFGENSVGKSSVIQSLLLLRQTKDTDKMLTYLDTNGLLTGIGNWNDLLCENAENDYIRFVIKNDDEIIIDKKYFNEKNGIKSKLEIIDTSTCNLFNSEFIYLNAQHFSPSVTYDISGFEKFARINKLGNYGQYVFKYIADNYNVKYSSSFSDNKEICDLYSLINQWLSKISDKVVFKMELESTIRQAEIKFYYKTKEGITTLPRNSLNVGYGLVHVLSIIYALITSNSNSLIIIENPESHLHPKAQTILGQLLSVAANNGAQIICETHSDHIINGIRLAIKEKQISNNDVVVTYFAKDDNLNTYGERLLLDENASFDNYPIGFLDEWENALVKLV